MITIISPTTGQFRKISPTITRDGKTYQYLRTNPQKNYQRETDWYTYQYTSAVSEEIGIQQPFILTNSSIGT